MKKETEKIKIPFGSNDSELYKFEYTIPEGYDARIEDGKVIVTKKEGEDDRIYNLIYSSIKNEMPIASPRNKELALAYLEKQKEQKPGDEDRYMEGYMNGINDALKGAKPAECEFTFDDVLALESAMALVSDDKELHGALKSIFERVHDAYHGEQKPAEWSEEDMDIINEVASILINDENRAVNKKEEDRLAYLAERIQSISPQPHWKPSEEQMKELLNALIPGKDFDCDILAELYKQLKKL